MLWKEMALEAFTQTLDIPKLDHGLAESYEYKGSSMCKKESCRKVFQSKADRDRHENLIHLEW